jgi:single-stranded-DNA-specific exonuclease
MTKRWDIKKVQVKEEARLIEALKIDPIVARLLVNRDILDSTLASQFLSPTLDKLHNPRLFKSFEKAIERIQRAKKEHQKILVYGDYDVDGVTSSALLTQALRELGLSVINHIPHRVKDGYGLNIGIAEFARDQHVKLLITVDCGITSFKEVEALNEVGIDVVIVDHHEPIEHKIPNAYAIVNPKQKDCPYPFKDLASVGLTFKLIEALRGKVDESILDLVSIGTIADVAPLLGENRILVKLGLPKINFTKNKGLSALLDVSKIKGKKLGPYHVGFILGPRINATGRMDSAHKSLDLFLSETSDEAYGLAQLLEKHNGDRQKMQREVVDEAFDIVEQEINFKDHKVIVLSKEGWHKGVLGIVASRLTDKYYRPSIVISIKDGVGTASARSIDGFHLHEVLEKCAKLLENYGGHEAAAGLTIKEENIDPFRLFINQVAQEVLAPTQLTPIINIDAQIPIHKITDEFADVVSSLEPFGEGNPEPVFASTQMIVKSHPALMGKDTIKFWVTDGKFTISAVGFGMAKYKQMITPGQKIDLAYNIIMDDWNKSPTPQLKIKDIRLSE